MLWPRLIGGDEMLVDLRLLYQRELDLGLLGGLFHALQRHAVLRQIDAMVHPEFVDHPADQPSDNVIALNPASHWRLGLFLLLRRRFPFRFRIARRRQPEPA